MCRATFILFLLGLPSFVRAEPTKRLAVVDVVQDLEGQVASSQLTEIFRAAFQSYDQIYVLGPEEIRSSLKQTNEAAIEYDRLIENQREALSVLNDQLELGKKFYRESRFEEAGSALSAAWSAIESSALLVSADVVRQVLELRAASYFFRGSEAQATINLETLYVTFPEYLVKSGDFPSGFVRFANQLRQERTSNDQGPELELSPNDVRIKFLGRESAAAVKLPAATSMSASHPVVFFKEGYLPELFQRSSLPARVILKSLRDQTTPTRGLFGVLGSRSMGPELIRLTKRVPADLFLLANITRDLDGNWYVRAQLLEKTTGKRSPLAQTESADLEAAIQNSVDSIVASLGADGQIQLFAFKKQEDAARIKESNFYETWWFWTAVGVGVAGLGAGTYFLMNQEDRLEFRVRGQQ